MKRLFFCILAMMALLLASVSLAQAQDSAPNAGATPAGTGKGLLILSATYADEAEPIRAGVVWRIFNQRAEADGSHPFVTQTDDALPSLTLPYGDYVVHVSYGLASATRSVTVGTQPASQRIALNAGTLKLIGVLGDKPIPAALLSISIYVPERGNAEAKLVMSNAHPGDIIGLPEGNYHIVSTYLDKMGVGSLNAGGNATNSVVAADIRVPAGQMVEATLKHRAALITLKLVNSPGGEALANTSFTVLTPGGDGIRDLIGAFPSLILAEGEYVAIARNNERTYQTVFKVQSAQDQDVEVLTKSAME